MTETKRDPTETDREHKQNDETMRNTLDKTQRIDWFNTRDPHDENSG